MEKHTHCYTWNNIYGDRIKKRKEDRYAYSLEKKNNNRERYRQTNRHTDAQTNRQRRSRYVV